MSGFLQWFSMHGYSMYIWPAYGLVFFVLTMNAFSVKWQGKRVRKFLQHWFKQV